MKKIVVFGASSSKNSINKTFSIYASKQIDNCEIIILDLNDYEMPIYSEDRQKELGIPKKGLLFYDVLKNCDGIIISFAEHNGSYTSAFKNIYDWISVIGKIVWWNKPMLLLSTSEGDRGAISVLNAAHERFSFDHKFTIPKFSLPNFSKNFKSNMEIINQEMKKDFIKAVNLFKLNLIGGDTIKTSSETVLSLTIFGSLVTNRFIRRSSAKSGDYIYVSGTIGDSALGLLCRKKGKINILKKHKDYLLNRYYAGNKDQFRTLLKEMIGDNQDNPETIVRTVKEYMFCNYEILEDELNDAVSIFKGDIPDNYFDGGGWTIDDSTVPKQFYDLLRFFVTLPEFQLK